MDYVHLAKIHKNQQQKIFKIATVLDITILVMWTFRVYKKCLKLSIKREESYAWGLKYISS